MGALLQHIQFSNGVSAGGKSMPLSPPSSKVPELCRTMATELRRPCAIMVKFGDHLLSPSHA